MSPRVGIIADDVVNAAVKIANQFGLHEVTMANLAKHLNVKSPSLYNHIDGLPELFYRLTLLALKDLYVELKNAAEGLVNEEALYALSSAYTSFARKNPGLYELTIQAPNSDQDELTKVARDILNLFEDCMKAYLLDEEATIHAIRGFRSILHGFTSIDQKKGFGLPIDTDKSLSFLIEAFLKGISVPVTPR